MSESPTIPPCPRCHLVNRDFDGQNPQSLCSHCKIANLNERFLGKTPTHPEWGTTKRRSYIGDNS